MKRKLFFVVGMLAMLLGLLQGPVLAAPALTQVVAPIPGSPLEVNITVVNAGEGGQTDPHASGDWVSYTDNSVYGVRFQNLDLGFPSDRIIPHSENFYDYLSDISGNSIVFLRVTSAGPYGIYLVQINPFGNPDPAVEVSPSATALRSHAVVGGDTIAYEDRGYDSTCDPQPCYPLREIALSSVLDPAAPAYRLTNDTLDDLLPAVSPDGNAVVWLKCTSPNVCDVWRAERTADVWGTPEQVTATENNESWPDTNGPVTVYGSFAGLDSWDRHIRWSVKDPSGAYVESELDLPGDLRNPNVSGSLIAFEGSAGQGAQFDLYLYNLATNRLYQLTDTPVSETLSDISTGPGGLVRVTWAQPTQVYPYDMNVYALSLVLDTTAPAITPDIQGTQGQNGWYTSDVTLSWAVSDDQSSFIPTGCDPLSLTADQAATDYTCSADGDGGASSASVTIARDATRPVTVVTGVEEGATYNLDSVPQAGCTTTDDLSGLAAEAAVALTGGDAQGVGQITATCSGALDAAGNAAEPAVVHFTVIDPVADTFSFTGFFQPVDNPGPGPSYVFNTVKAGSAIPVKFSLAGDQGLDIFSPNYPSSRPTSCTSANLTELIEETMTAGSSSLSYDTASDTYTYVWKTEKKWAGTCRMLNVMLSDGTQHPAYFNFK